MIHGNKFISKEIQKVMVKYYVVRRIVVSLVFMLPAICLGAQDTWSVVGMFKSPDIREHKYTLEIFREKQDGKDVCYAVLKLNESQWQARIDDFSEDHVCKIEKKFQSLWQRRQLKQKPMEVYLSLSHQNEDWNFCVTSMKENYGPKEYHNLPECWLSTNGLNMEIHYRDRDKGRQEVQLYKRENIKKIVDALNQGKGCIIALKTGTTEPKLIKVADYGSSSLIWWDGWKPESSKFDAWYFGIEKKTEYNVVNINVDEDAEHKAIYTKNQRVVSLIKILSFASGCLILYCFLDKINEILEK